jgi:hypothetical protein
MLIKMKVCLLFIFNLTSLILFSQGYKIEGTVFNDRNGNGLREQNESGLSNVVVSDQISFAITNQDGYFSIDTNSEFPFLFISQPSGYVGKYYYPKASKMNFPLQQAKDQEHFKFIHASDTHIDSLNLPRMQRFRQMADSIGAEFIIISGDLIRDALRVDEATARNYFEMFVAEMEKFKMPVYTGVGNHELFGIERDKSHVNQNHSLYGKNMFRHYLGPNYYSFNYGGIHYISLDVVDFQDMYYFGGLDSVQLKWLANDLSYVPENMPLIIFNHIPFMSPGFSFQDFESDDFYGPQLLLQKGKLQHRHIVYNYDEVKAIVGDRKFPLALSGHYHSAQESQVIGSNTLFAQTAAIAGPDQFEFKGFKIQSGFTLYETKGGKIVSKEFVPLNFR